MFVVSSICSWMYQVRRMCLGMFVRTVVSCVRNVHMIVNGGHCTVVLAFLLLLQVFVLYCFLLSFFGSFMRATLSSPSHPDSQRFGPCCPQWLGVKGCGTYSPRCRMLQCVVRLSFSCAAHFYCDTQSLSRYLVHGAGGSPKYHSIGETLQTRSLYFLLNPI